MAVMNHHSSLNVELLAVVLHPYYLPRDFTVTFEVTVYIPLSANVASSTLPSQNLSLKMLFCNFIHAAANDMLPKCYQFVDCAKRVNSTLDLYGSMATTYPPSSPQLLTHDHIPSLNSSAPVPTMLTPHPPELNIKVMDKLWESAKRHKSFDVPL